MSSDIDAEHAHDAGAPTTLARTITGPLLFLFILGDVLGAGIYALMGVLSGKVGGVLWAPLVLALLMALLTAGSYAELVTKYPRAGGAAVFAERAFGIPLLSFLVGFSMLAAGVTSAAGLALAFSGDYLATFVDVPVVGAALVFLVLVACLNARGISESLKTNVVMTIIELSGLVIVVVVVAVMVGRGSGQADVGRVVEFPDGSTPAVAILSGAIIAYYSFVGFETSANVVEEIKEPSRVYPRALFAATDHRGGDVRARRHRECRSATGIGTVEVLGAAPGRRRRVGGGHSRLGVQLDRAHRRGQRSAADDDHVQSADLRHGRAGVAPGRADQGAAQPSHAVGGDRGDHGGGHGAHADR